MYIIHKYRPGHKVGKPSVVFLPLKDQKKIINFLFDIFINFFVYLTHSSDNMEFFQILIVELLEQHFYRNKKKVIIT